MVKRTFPVAMGRHGLSMIENFHVYDMVWGLTHINRFCGKGDRQVSDAAHLWHCYNLTTIWQPENTDLKLYSLVHDFPEAYYNDHPGFLKVHYGPDYKFLNDEMDEIIFSQLGLTKARRIELEHDLKEIDNNALALEAEYAFDKFEAHHWPSPDLYDKIDIISDILEGYDDVGLYNLIINELEGIDNEVLRNTLQRAQPVSHPKRNSSGLASANYYDKLRHSL